MIAGVVVKKTACAAGIILFLFCLIPMCSNPGSPECEQEVRQFLNYIDNGEYEQAIDMTAETMRDQNLPTISTPLSESRRSQRIDFLINQYGRAGERYSGEIVKIESTYAKNRINSSDDHHYCYVTVVTAENVGKAKDGADYQYSFSLSKINDNPWKIISSAFIPV